MKMRVFFWLLAFGVFALPGVGCDSKKSCQDLCEAANACTDFPDETPCEQRCKDREAFLKESDCVEAQDTYDACVSELEDICTATDHCPNEALAIFDCTDDYCKANPSASGCTP